MGWQIRGHDCDRRKNLSIFHVFPPCFTSTFLWRVFCISAQAGRRAPREQTIGHDCYLKMGLSFTIISLPRVPTTSQNFFVSASQLHPAAARRPTPGSLGLSRRRAVQNSRHPHEAPARKTRRPGDCIQTIRRVGYVYRALSA